MDDGKVQDLQLPLAVINRIVKDALPPGAITKNEAKLALARAASVFILYLTSGALINIKCRSIGILWWFLATSDVCATANQKTISANHVMSALKEIEFDFFIPELEKQLENYRKCMKERKEKKLSINAEKTNGNDSDVVEVADDE
jgi:DNA polymerase epsilon subunit 3